MAFVTTARIAASLLPSPDRRPDAPGLRPEPERVVLGVQTGLAPSSKPAVRIFLGTEPAQHRAERVFVWSIEQTRDPSRVYEIYLLKNLAGFNRRRWLTGFTNYRFAIPHFAGNSGRAIWNDVDQAYLADPAELFDADMEGHGFLMVPPLWPGAREDSSVMLIDCARMAPVWTLKAAQYEHKNTLLARALAVPRLRGYLASEWNARDEEYVAGRSKLLHWTCLHTQPWQPVPGRFVYQHNPVGYVWFDLKRSADAAGFQVFTLAHPSREYVDLLEHVRAGGKGKGSGAARLARAGTRAQRDGTNLDELITEARAQTLLDYQLARAEALAGTTSPAGLSVSCYNPAFVALSDRPTGRFDAVCCSGVLGLVPAEDWPWIIEDLFSYARRFVVATVDEKASRQELPEAARLPGHTLDRGRLYEYFEAAGRRHPELYWRLVLYNGNALEQIRDGGRRLVGAPSVWVLSDGDEGNSRQSLALARALGWPFDIKELSGKDVAVLAAPWPDLVIAAGRSTALAARWIGKQSKGRTRLVHLGVDGCEAAERFDVVVTPAYHHMPPHPHRIETTAPLTPLVDGQEADEQANRCRRLFGTSPRPHVVLLVGGRDGRCRLDTQGARRLGEEVQAWTRDAGGSVFAVTTGPVRAEIAGALVMGLGESIHLHWWRPGEGEEVCQAYLRMADAVVVAGGGESVLAETVALAKPVYIYPLEQQRPGPLEQLRKLVAARSQARPMNRRGTVRPQQGLEYLCARMVAKGIVHQPPDLPALRAKLIHSGLARPFGTPLEIGKRPMLREAEVVAHKVRTLLGLAGA